MNFFFVVGLMIIGAMFSIGVIGSSILFWVDLISKF